MPELPNSGPARNDADAHLDRLLGGSVEEAWYKSLIQSVKDIVNPPKLPPLEVTSKPVQVKDIWGMYAQDKKSGMASLIIHGTFIALLFTVFSSKMVQDKIRDTTLVFTPDISPYQPKGPVKPKTAGGGGGGGDRSPLPASKGKLPKISPKQFTPPMAVVNNPNPKLIMDPSIIVPPDQAIPQNNLPNFGDPLAKLGPPSNGIGSGGGIGSGSGGGVGSGRGAGVGPGEGGGIGGGVFRVGGGVTQPQLVYKVEPEYSEEARKAKYSGVVVLYVEVEPGGKARNIRVVKGIGLGLDEKAIEAVAKWRFKPGLKDGRAVTVAATIEVNFRLL